MNFKNYTLIDWVTVVGIVASLLLVGIHASGCALHAKVYTAKAKGCCDRLDVRTKEMDEFNRYCMMMVFADRKETDEKILKDVKHRVELCKFVFGVTANDDLLSLSKDKAKHFDKVRSYTVPLRSGAWHPPIGCDPHDIHCEEF